MTTACSIRAALVLAILPFAACSSERNVEIRVPRKWNFTLHSWKSASGRWSFSLCSIEAAERTPWKDVREQFSSVDALKRRLARLSPGTRMNWYRYPEIGFEYPPREVIADIQAFAKAHHIDLSFEFVPLE